MKTIMIFGADRSMLNPRIYIRNLLHDDTARIHYFSEHEMKNNLTKLHGHEPDLIINLSEPFDELSELQKYKAVMKDAQIINLY